MAAKKKAKKAAKGKKGLARHGDAATVKVKADPARKKRFDALLASMHKSERNEALGFDAYWEAVGEILDADLWVLGGYESADDFLAEEVKEPRRTALRNVRVAKWASPQDEASYGTTLLDAAMSWLEASTGGPPKQKVNIDFAKLRVAVEREGTSKKLPLSEVRVEEVRAATRKLLDASGKGSKKTPRSASESAIVKALRANKSLAGVSAHVSDGKLRLANIPLFAVKDLLAALRGLALPVET